MSDLSPDIDAGPFVVQGTREDADEILRWLKAEFEIDHEGFWSNRNLINRAVDDEELWVIRESDVAVAFQVGTYAPDILCVRQDRQGQGLGSTLFAATLARAEADDVVILDITCMPRESLSFWRKQGFEPTGPVLEWGEIPARRILGRTFQLPDDLPKAQVEVLFHSEQALYDDTIGPFDSQIVTGAVMADGEIALERRVIGVSPDSRDLAVKLLVDGRELCFCKAKYPEAEALGIRRAKGSAFLIDVVQSAEVLRARF